MSSDLLAEFDSFYRAPRDDEPRNSAPASNDLVFLSDSKGTPQAGQQSGFQQWQSQPPKPVGDVWGDTTSFQSVANTQPAAALQADIWGSFEGDAGSTHATPSSKPVYAGGNMSGGSEAQKIPNKPAVSRRPTLDFFSNHLEGATEQFPQRNSVPVACPPPQPATVSKSSYGEVLFDADDVSAEAEDDDEFGEFESVSPQAPSEPPPSQSLNAMFGATSPDSKSSNRPNNLLSMSKNTNSGMLPYPQAPNSLSFQERYPLSELGLSAKSKQVSTVKKEEKPSSASPNTVWPTFVAQKPKPSPNEDSTVTNNQVDDDWGDFADLPPQTLAIKSAKTAPGIEADAWAWDATDQVSERPSAPVEIALPTNIPPPSVLLSLFPSIFDLPQSALFKPVANQPFSLKNRIISDPSTVEFLRAYLLIATVAARIIAGRKLRWKRDTLLSQQMKIGPAAAGGKGGMKLAGVDKAEITREDREAADVVRVWKDQLGRLRSTIAVANSSIHNASQQLTIPDVSEAMHIKTEARGLTAPKPCLICGLKREERVNKVDVDVEDSFGEWWIDHWGHRACRNFWLEHESKLKHR